MIVSNKDLTKQFNSLVGELKSKDFKKGDIDKIRKTWEFAKLAHTGQKRLTGDAFVSHPLAVAKLLLSWNLDATTIMAGLLHDTIEDGGAKREDLIDEFGEDVTVIVDGVTNVTQLKLKGSMEEFFTENLRKMILVMAKDLRVVLVRLADRLHNMQTLAPLPKEKRVRISLETLEVYAPLAERLGIGEIKGQLEDLAFPYVYPGEYKKLLEKSKEQYKEAEAHIKKMRRTLLTQMAKEGVRATINGRKKHLYSLWRKLQRPGIDGDFDKINDIVALRVITKTIPECYTALGVVHSTYKPVPLIGISDFIAQPKPNGYRSIHTKVFGPGERFVEVQIRTQEMHEEAEFGIAAHWSYSLAKSKGTRDEVLEHEGIQNSSSRLSWVKQLVDWQQTMNDTEEFLQAVKFDALSHRNFVFSPKGDVYDLPRGATPVDFAYQVHTDIPKSITGAKVNGKMVPLDYKLKSGDVVEIVKSKNPKGPNKDWLEFVKTTTAKREIRRFLYGKKKG